MTEQERIDKAIQEIKETLQRYSVTISPKIVHVSGSLIVSLTEVEIQAVK